MVRITNSFPKIFNEKANKTTFPIRMVNPTGNLVANTK